MPKIITSNSSSSGASEFQQLNADWESTRGVTEILNKPTNATTTKDGFMSKEDKEKLDNIGNIPTNLSQLTKDINFDERYYTESEVDTKLSGKVDSSRVLTDVPIGAKFSDTITTINGKTGVITKSDITALGIPSQDTVYTHPVTAGNKHIPSGGNIGQVLKNISSGTATWEDEYSYTHPATHSINEVSGLQSALDSKVDNSRVLTDVPLNAKFTDTNTTYSEITTAEIDAGTSSTLRTITGRRVKYIIDTVSTMISTAVGLLTKSDIGLGNVDDVQQASKVEFNTHNTDATRHITSVERTKWNTVDSKSPIGHEHTTSDISNFPTSLPASGGNADTVGGFTVGVNVPSNAKFTDTTYSEITTAEIDVGTSSTSRVITGRRVQYILNKVGEMISTAIGALNKSSVGLSNVDNTSDLNKPISTATQSALDGKVNNSQVLTNVPSGAKFTDTVTTINGKTGAIAKADIVALGIPTSDTNTTYSAGTGLVLTGTQFTPDFGTGAGKVVQGNDARLVDARTPLAHNHTKSEITDFPTLATVATSGDYSDLSGKPTIPTDTNQLAKTDVYTKTEVNDLMSSAGQGDMVKAVYDTDNNGIVDNAEKVNGFTVGVSVPANAEFTDTIYTHPATHSTSMITGLDNINIDGGTF